MNHINPSFSRRFLLILATLAALGVGCTGNKKSNDSPDIPSQKTRSVVLRAEVKEGERRSILSPDDVRSLVKEGIAVDVEKSGARAFPDSEFEAAGAKLVKSGKWEQGEYEVVAGLKELPSDFSALSGTHFYFSHTYKGQAGAYSVLDRFRKGNGTIVDLEFIVDENGKRVAAFGKWAGSAGMYLGLLRWAHRKLGYSTERTNEEIRSYNKVGQDIFRSSEAQAHLKNLFRQTGTPKVVVIGATGRSGTGAVEMAESSGVPGDSIRKLGRSDTSDANQYDELIKWPDVLVNCVVTYPGDDARPFITAQSLNETQGPLSVVVDVTADTTSDLNRLPFLTEETSFENAVVSKSYGGRDIEAIVIDHLPTLFPRESSIFFSSKIIPHLKSFLIHQSSSEVERAIDKYKEVISQLEDKGAN